MFEKREFVDFLEDVIGAMEKAERFIADMSYEEFMKDEKNSLRGVEGDRSDWRGCKTYPFGFSNGIS